jgi:hypothetical protein
MYQAQGHVPTRCLKAFSVQLLNATLHKSRCKN